MHESKKTRPDIVDCFLFDSFLVRCKILNLSTRGLKVKNITNGGYLGTFYYRNVFISVIFQLKHFPFTSPTAENNDSPSCPVRRLGLPFLIPFLAVRFISTGAESNREVTAFKFGLLKTGDKKPAAIEESRILKDVIYHLCQKSARTGRKTAGGVRQHSLLSIF